MSETNRVHTRVGEEPAPTPASRRAGRPGSSCRRRTCRAPSSGRRVVALGHERRAAARDVDRPAGERPRRLADVVLGVVAHPEGEQLHELARQVLVGRPTRLPPPSSHSSIAGSTAIACASARKSPRAEASLASRSGSPSGGAAHLRMLVAKWPCQNHVIRSGNGASAAAIRSSHQTTSPRCAPPGLPQRLARERVVLRHARRRRRRREWAWRPRRRRARRGEGVERGVEPGGGGGVQLARPRPEPQPLEQAADGVALTDRGHVAMVARQCSSNVRNRPGARPRRGRRGAYRGTHGARVRGSAGRGARRARGVREPGARAVGGAVVDLHDVVDRRAGQGRRDRPGQLHHPARGAGVPGCARYVAEVGNAALATQGAAASVAGADALEATAGRLADEVGQFSRTGCVAAPGVAGPPRRSAATRCRRSSRTSRRCAPSSRRPRAPPPDARLSRRGSAPAPRGRRRRGPRGG